MLVVIKAPVCDRNIVVAAFQKKTPHDVFIPVFFPILEWLVHPS